MDAHLQSLVCEMHACNARIAAMQAGNAYWAALGIHDRSHSEKEFYREADTLKHLAQSMRIHSNL